MDGRRQASYAAALLCGAYQNQSSGRPLSDIYHHIPLYLICPSQVPFVGFNVVKQAESAASHGVFIMVQASREYLTLIRRCSRVRRGRRR
jgi:hypothetical protein